MVQSGQKVMNCNTGDVLAKAQEQASKAVLKALDTAAASRFCAAAAGAYSSAIASTHPN
jgi:hypothetical protein